VFLKQDSINAELWEIDAQGQVVPRQAEDFLKNTRVEPVDLSDPAPRDEGNENP
jgi:hypothetical protein